jgi:hypothetical protein
MPPLQKVRGSEAREAVEIDGIKGAQPDSPLEALYAFC